MQTEEFNREPNSIDFAIIGAQKSATTTIQLALAQHPEIHIPEGEIACFESPDYEQGRPAKQLRFLDNKQNLIIGIKRPNILPDFRAVHRLKQHSPSCKLIVILRDPVERFVSAYFHTMNSSKIPVMDINRAVHAMFEDYYLSRYPVALTLLHYGLYYDSLRDIINSFGSESLFITTQQRVRSDLETLLSEICDYLTIGQMDFSESAVPRNLGSYDYRRARFLRIANLFKYNYSAGRLRKEISENPLRRLIGGSISRLSRYRPFSNPLESRVVLDDASNNYLKAYYAADRNLLLSSFGKHVYW